MTTFRANSALPTASATFDEFLDSRKHQHRRYNHVHEMDVDHAAAVRVPKHPHDDQHKPLDDGFHPMTFALA